MFQILILFSVLACTKSQTSLSKIKSADVTSCVDNATLGLKERFGADYSCFTTDFSTYVDGDNLSAQCESIKAQCQSMSTNTQVTTDSSVPLSTIPSNSVSDSSFNPWGTPISADNPVAPEYNFSNQIQGNNSGSSITDPSFNLDNLTKDKANSLDPYGFGFSPYSSPAPVSNEPYADLLGSLSSTYKYDSDAASRIINLLSKSDFEIPGLDCPWKTYPTSCGAPAGVFTGCCFHCVGNGLDSIGRWTNGMDGPNRNYANSVAQVSYKTALESGYLDITAKFPTCGGPYSHPVNPAPPPGSVIVYDHGRAGHITVMKDDTVACADSCTKLEDTLAGYFKCLKIFMLVKPK